MATLANLTFAAESPGMLCEFWAAALGYQVQGAPPVVLEMIERGELEADSAAAAVDPTGQGPRLFFEKKIKTPDRPVPLHMDLYAPDRDAEVERLIGLGATLVKHHERDLGGHIERWTELRDPEGNGFCVQG